MWEGSVTDALCQTCPGWENLHAIFRFYRGEQNKTYSTKNPPPKKNKTKTTKSKKQK